MAALKQKIQQDLTTALREKRELELSVLRMLNAAITNKEKAKRYKISKEKPELTEAELGKESGLLEDEVLEIISSEIKKRKEAALLFEKGKRMDLSEKEKEEAKILEKYLPEQLSEEEIKKLARDIIAALQASLVPEEREKIGIKDTGKIMAGLMPKLKGKADGSLVSKIIRELLAQ